MNIGEFLDKLLNTYYSRHRHYPFGVNLPSRYFDELCTYLRANGTYCDSEPNGPQAVPLFAGIPCRRSPTDEWRIDHNDPSSNIPSDTMAPIGTVTSVDERGQATVQLGDGVGRQHSWVGSAGGVVVDGTCGVPNCVMCRSERERRAREQSRAVGTFTTAASTSYERDWRVMYGATHTSRNDPVTVPNPSTVATESSGRSAGDGVRAGENADGASGVPPVPRRRNRNRPRDRQRAEWNVERAAGQTTLGFQEWRRQQPAIYHGMPIEWDVITSDYAPSGRIWAVNAATLERAATDAWRQYVRNIDTRALSVEQRRALARGDTEFEVVVDDTVPEGTIVVEPPRVWPRAPDMGVLPAERSPDVEANGGGSP